MNIDFMRLVDCRSAKEAERGTESLEDREFSIDLIDSGEAGLDGSELNVCDVPAKNNF